MVKKLYISLLEKKDIEFTIKYDIHHVPDKLSKEEALKEYANNTIEIYNEPNCMEWFYPYNFIRGHKQVINNEKSDGFFHYLLWFFTMLDLKIIGKTQYPIYLEAKNIIKSAYPEDNLFEKVEHFKNNPEEILKDIKGNLWDWSKQWPNPQKAQFHMYFKAYNYQGTDKNFKAHVLNVIDNEKYDNKYQYKTVVGTAKLYHYFYPTDTKSIAYYIAQMKLDNI